MPQYQFSHLPDAQADEFQNVISSSLSTDTAAVDFHEGLFSGGLT